MIVRMNYVIIILLGVNNVDRSNDNNGNIMDLYYLEV